MGFAVVLAAVTIATSDSNVKVNRRFFIEQMKSNHSTLREAFLRRGWTDAVSARPGLKSPRVRGFDFKWTWSWERADLNSDSQIVNHYPSFEELTTVRTEALVERV